MRVHNWWWLLSHKLVLWPVGRDRWARRRVIIFRKLDGRRRSDNTPGPMKPRTIFTLLTLLALPLFAAPTLEKKPADASFAKFEPVRAPAQGSLLLKKGDRVAICGDSITEQKMYSRIMETYLTICVPELNISVRQYGWSGERAPGFLARMTNDCLRFSPTIATTCYGMNDHEYRPYEERIGKTYREKQTAIVQSFKKAGVRVVLGSGGTVGKMPHWVKTASGTVEDLNLNLCKLRNIDIEIARQERVAFADVFWPMMTAGFDARQRFGSDFAISGKDGVHPGWAGQLVMAQAFLKALGLKGNIGTITVDLANGKSSASTGHKIVSSKPGETCIESRRYPFCASDAADRDDGIRAGMALTGFNQELNRLMLVARNGRAKRYKVTWGENSKSYAASELARGINLADDFPVNPFCQAFKKVEDAVLAKQAYETTQIKKEFHGPNGKKDMEATVKRTEAERTPLAAAIKTAFVPVSHTIKIEAE